MVLMPVRAFIDSDEQGSPRTILKSSNVLMPVRAFIDSDETREEQIKWITRECLNAREGFY